MILSSSVFSGEYASGMTPILHPAKFGRHAFAHAKLAALLLLLSAVFFAVTAAVCVTVGALWGFENPGADIRVITSAAYVTMANPISCAALILLQTLVGFSAVVTTASVCAVVSALVKSPYAAMIIGAGILFFSRIFPMENIISRGALRVLTLLPLNQPQLLSSSWELFDYSVWIAAAVAASSAVIAAAALMLCSKVYANHRIA